MAENGQVIRLLESIKESLEREMGGLGREVGGLRRELHDFRSEVIARFDTQDARLERHAALWQTGSRWSARMDAWAEKVDGNANTAQKQIMELTERVRQLERRLDKADPPKS